MLRNNFSIESFISSAYSNKSTLAIGYFLIHIKGITYGIKEFDATALANSYDEVLRRLSMRGKHIAPHDLIILPSLELAQIAENALYGDVYDNQELWVFSMLRRELADLIYKNNLIWAPDGDEAFDDGSRVFQFDIDDETVRLIGYNTTADYKIDEDKLTDLIISSDEYYSTLEEWSNKFYNEWENFDKRQTHECP
jgi:hypothetical protein